MSQTAAASVHYREVQKFRQLWIWLVLLVACVPVMGVFAFGLVSHFAFDNPWGRMSDGGMAATAALAIGLPLALIGAFYFIALITEVSEEGVRIWFYPFYRRTIRLDEIESYEAVRYNSLTEYGGWGIRWSPRRGWAYNVAGISGARLSLTRDRRVTIGSANADELASAIRDAMH